MNIAYSCAGEGFGHAARMVVLSKPLEEAHRVSYFVPREVQPFLREKLGSFEARSIPVLSFAKKGDRVLLFRTMLRNLPVILSFPFRAMAMAAGLRKDGIACVISDFEPLLAWAGRLAGIPVLQMNHPGIIARHRGKGLSSALSILGAKLMEGPHKRRIHISFYGGEVGPLLRKNLFDWPLEDRRYILLNLKPSYRGPVLDVLKRYSDLSFKVFPAAGENFEEALAGCSAVISSAGHQIIAECLALGKPLLVLPQQGQYEQELNARMLETLGRGMKGSIATLDRDLQVFLGTQEGFRNAARNTVPPGFRLADGTGDLVKAVMAFIEDQQGGTVTVETLELDTAGLRADGSGTGKGDTTATA